MSFSAETQTALKTAQLLRLEAKGEPGYGALYAAQPSQMRKAAAYRAERKLEHDSKNAENVQALADAQEGANAFASITTKKGAR